MKVALCFLISYDHVLVMESLWREWIEPNAHFINVYFFYKHFSKIRSPWIRQHALPLSHIVPTTYASVVPGYLSVLQYAYSHDRTNRWFCMLTDTCCPIVSPAEFRRKWYAHAFRSVFSWRPAWWNVHSQRRANLAALPPELHLANDPWFTLTRQHVGQILDAAKHTHASLVRRVCAGPIANESVFAILLFLCGELRANNARLLCSPSHAADWTRMSSPTSPYVFGYANDRDMAFLEEQRAKNPCLLFVRKVSCQFPDDVPRYFWAQDDGAAPKPTAWTRVCEYMYFHVWLWFWCLVLGDSLFVRFFSY